MDLMKLIIAIQALLGTLCLAIQLYALTSSKWAIFQSRIELGLVEEHGHYGLWSICTSKLIPAEMDDDGHVLNMGIADCEPMNTFFKPSHSRTFMAIFSIAHTVALTLFAYRLVIKFIKMCLIEHYYHRHHHDHDHHQRHQYPSHDNNEPNHHDDDFEHNQNYFKRMFVIVVRFIIAKIFNNNNSQTIPQEDSNSNVKRQIRIKLYTISLAAAFTSMTLLSAITPRKPLRETDLFQVNNVSTTNYRVWRGAGFWAQLTTLILDMLITSLIAIEVRVLFVLQLQQQQSQQQEQQITTTCSTSDNKVVVVDVGGDNNDGDGNDDDPNYETQEVIINPFFRHNSLRTTTTTDRIDQIGDGLSDFELYHHNHHRQQQQSPPPLPLVACIDTREDTMTTPKTMLQQQQQNSRKNSDYVNSKEVRKLKKLMMNANNINNAANQCSSTTPTSTSKPFFTGGTSYYNPMFDDNEPDGPGSSSSQC